MSNYYSILQITLKLGSLSFKLLRSNDRLLQVLVDTGAMGSHSTTKTAIAIDNKLGSNLVIRTAKD